MQTLTTAETQEPQEVPAAAPGAAAAALLAQDPEEQAESGGAGAAAPARRQHLLFDPEPQQRMVVVRRRRRSGSRKRVTRSEKLVGQIRGVLLVIILGALAVKMVGLHRVAGYLGQFRTALHPLKTRLHAPDLEVIVLVLVAVGLLYTMPGVQSRVNRALGIGGKRG